MKVNEALVNAFIEKWRPETHTFHLECEETTITLQDVSDDAVDENSLLLSWLVSQFANIHDFTDNQQGLERFAHSWILRFIGGVMFVDKSSKMVSMRYLQFLRDLRECSTYMHGKLLFWIFVALTKKLLLNSCIKKKINWCN